ncbi:MAG: alkaline phosphatase D family protein [Polyangiaceae bacterium]
MLTLNGAYHTSFGTLSLTQSGTSVKGSYTHEDGRLEGVLDGHVLRGTWTQSPPGKRGPMELRFDDFGNCFQGNWRLEGATDWQGPWDGTRTTLLPREVGGSPGAWNSRADGPLLSGPLVGEVGERDVRIWVQSRKPSPLTITVKGPGGFVKKRTIAPAWFDWMCGVFVVDGLSPATSYDYEIEGEGGSTGTLRFRTAPPVDAHRAKIAFGSCFWNWPDPNLDIFNSIGAEDPDLFVMLGDNCYFVGDDTLSEHTMMMSQLRHRNNATFRELVARTPTVAVWDDHDFGPNDCDGDFPGKPLAYSAFQRMWANRTYGTPTIAGIFSRVRCGPVDVFLLDERYYRGTEGNNVLGAAQLAWLADELARSYAPIKMIASSSQMLAHTAVKKGWDCWRKDGPHELERVMSLIESHEIRGVVIVSGDLHMSNLLHEAGRPLADGRRGPEFWELTTSPLANDPWKESIAGDPAMVREVIDRTTYGVLDVDLDRAGAEVCLILRDHKGGTIFEQPIPFADLRVR